VYSIVKNTDYLVLSISLENVQRMVRQIARTDIDTSELVKIIVPKNIDIISFVNDLALKSKVAPKYIISGNIDTYHPQDGIYHQTRFNNGICNIIIKDTYDDVMMGGSSGTGSEDCPGTKNIVNFYKNSYDAAQLRVLNADSTFVRGGGGGIFSVLERNIAEFIVYLSYSKTNDILRIIKSRNPNVNVDLASSFEVVERTDGSMFDIVRKFRENKDTNFFLRDGKTGTEIKMTMDPNIPEMKSDTTAEYYHEEMMRNLASYRAGTADTLLGAIRSADDRIKRSMSVGVKTGMVLAKNLLKDGWKIEEVNGVDCFVHPDKVYVTSVVGNDGRKYSFPEECKDIMYLYDITVPIDACLHGLNNNRIGVKAKGFHPHRSSGASNYYNDLEHTDELQVVCIGDLDGKPIENIVNLVDTLSCANRRSMMGNAASRCISTFFGEEYAVMSSDAKSKEVKKIMEYIKPFLDNKGIAIKKPSVTKKKDSGDDHEPVMRSVRSGGIFTAE